MRSINGCERGPDASKIEMPEGKKEASGGGGNCEKECQTVFCPFRSGAKRGQNQLSPFFFSATTKGTSSARPSFGHVQVGVGRASVVRGSPHGDERTRRRVGRGKYRLLLLLLPLLLLQTRKTKKRKKLSSFLSAPFSVPQKTDLSAAGRSGCTPRSSPPRHMPS